MGEAAEPASTGATDDARPPGRALARRHPHLTVDERVARGKQARQQAARSSQGTWEPLLDRPDPVGLLEAQAESRNRELVPIRHGRMLVSPFTFYRGAAVIMAADLAATPRSGLNVQLCGDAHLSNFGAFGSPERQLLFDINDFDETLPGPWEWDVKRLVASFEVAGRDRGFAPSDRREIVLSAAREYRESMTRSATKGALQTWYTGIDADEIMKWVRSEVRAKDRADQLERVERIVAKARARDHVRVFTKVTTEVGGRLRIVADPPLIMPIDELVLPGMAREETVEWMQGLIASYRESLAHEHHPFEEYTYVDSAHKVVGVGSVGTGAWIHLFLGRDDNDPLILQAKEAQASVLEPFLGRSVYDNHARRVVAGQRLMQAASDIFLGWLRVEGLDGKPYDYYVRQLHDWKGSVDLDTARPLGYRLYARLCGRTLARAHARWGDRIAIASYLGRRDVFDRAMARFAVAYADQNERDYETFAAAVSSGRLEAETGV